MSRKYILSQLERASESPHKKIEELANISEPFFPVIDKKLSLYFKEQLESVQGVCKLFNTLEEAFNFLQSLITENKWNDIRCIESTLQTQLSKHNILFGASDTFENNCEVAITSCECLVARTGSVLLSSAQLVSRKLSVYADTHLVIAYSTQLVTEINDGLRFLNNKYIGHLPTQIIFVSGQSRTADIEKTLVLGAHGPKAIYVLLIEQ